MAAIANYNPASSTPAANPLLPSEVRINHSGTKLLAALALSTSLTLNLPHAAGASESAMYFVHSNHLGTPELLTDESGTVLWKADYHPFGQISLPVSSNTANIRFPGQYFDAETGLHYNYFRDYDPYQGRYLQSDPIGLGGGINTYLYANSNAIMFIDPRGLLVWQGKYFYFGASEIIGGGRFIFNLISECINGKQVQVRVLVNAVGVDIGSPVTEMGGHLEFDDARSTPDPAAFETEFLYVGVSASFGIGASLSAMSFDRGTIQSHGLSLVGGVDVSLFTELSGVGQVEFPAKVHDCSCGVVKRIY